MDAFERFRLTRDRCKPHIMIELIQVYQLHKTTPMQPTTIQALDARQRLGELLELVYYQGKRFRIARKDKSMAWIVGEPFMVEISRIVDHIIVHEPALADTLAITLDHHLQSAITQGTQEVKERKTVPVESILSRHR